MKKIKVLPLVLALPLLVGCNKVGQPRFAKEGDKVDYEALVAAFDEAKKGNAFYLADENQHIPSSLTNVNIKMQGEETLDRDEKEVYKDDGYTITKSSSEYDANNSVIREKIKQKTKGSVKDQTSKEKDNGTHKELTYCQKYSEEGKDYVISADTINKTFRIRDVADETHPYSAIFDDYSLSLFAEGAYYFVYMLDHYPTSSDERKQEFSFYKNDKIFTLEVKHEEEEEEKDAQEEVVRTEKSTAYIKVQIDLSKNESIKCLTYLENTQTITYKKNSGNYYAGDIRGSKTIIASDAKIAKKDIKLDPVDLTGYKKTLQ